MNFADKLFLEALNAALQGKKVDWDFEIPLEEWNKLLKRAEIHKVLPLIYNAVFKCPSIQMLDQDVLERIKKVVVRQVMIQTMKTDEFLQLYKHLQNEGINPLVVKGITLRQLYPNPDYRSSSDEDMLIRAEDFDICHKALEKYGMRVRGEQDNLFSKYEVPYVKEGSPLYIELHKYLFNPESKEYGDLNGFFEGVHKKAVNVNVQGTDVLTLSYTENLFYLICHAFKHFLHSGFGVRQLCDMVMFANAYGQEIDWKAVLEMCKEIRADKFAAALFIIGEKYLNFQPEKACYPVEWKCIRIDEVMLLQDMLQGGVYGDSDMNRKRSSTLTLGAVRDDKSGKRAKMRVAKAMFPGVENLKGRYPYLELYPALLPVAWMDRIVKYQLEILRMSDSKVTESLQIGNQRIELLKKYEIVE